MPDRIWVDVEDLFQYANFNARLSGIQRIEFELCRSLALLPETRDRVGFVRHASAQGSFHAIPFAEIDALHARLSGSPTATARHAIASPPPGEPPSFHTAFRRIAYRIPLDLRTPLIAMARGQATSLRAAASLTSTVLTRLCRRLRLRRKEVPPRALSVEAAATPAFAEAVSPGDVLLVLGSTWFHPFYGQLLTRVRKHWRLRIVLLVYDIIPLLRPEWCEQNLTDRFRHWAQSALPEADILLTISRSSAHDLQRFADRTGLALRSTPTTIPIGTGFSTPPRQVTAPAAARDRKLPEGRYVLMVSTIEARKNHALLVRVWRRMLDELSAAQVPTLVFAGRVGWLVDDLMQQLRNARYLDGKVVVIEDPQDRELEQLYAGCLFTVFPSFYEGWGLPVTESLGFGRPCIISNASALPEAGGTLARFFDPENGGEAFRVIRDAVEDAAGTEAWAARVATDFVRVSWDESTRAILRTIDQDRSRYRVSPTVEVSASGA